MDEVLGLRKRDGSPGLELRSMRIEELSAVDHPAHGIADWLLITAADRAVEKRAGGWGRQLAAGSISGVRFE
ncbi:MAG: hypothetical protein M3265_01655 [Actinomycetota bacterium]|nr:hypothetical protein [Actinomycetota bacterium]